MLSAVEIAGGGNDFCGRGRFGVVPYAGARTGRPTPEICLRPAGQVPTWVGAVESRHGAGALNGPIDIVIPPLPVQRHANRRPPLRFSNLLCRTCSNGTARRSWNCPVFRGWVGRAPVRRTVWPFRASWRGGCEDGDGVDRVRGMMTRRGIGRRPVRR